MEPLVTDIVERLRFIGNGQVTPEVILISAKDLDTGTWPRQGSWEAARQRHLPTPS